MPIELEIPEANLCPAEVVASASSYTEDTTSSSGTEGHSPVTADVAGVGGQRLATGRAFGD